MIVALARKLLIALWRMVLTGEVPQGIVLGGRNTSAQEGARTYRFGVRHAVGMIGRRS